MEVEDADSSIKKAYARIDEVMKDMKSASGNRCLRSVAPLLLQFSPLGFFVEAFFGGGGSWRLKRERNCIGFENPEAVLF